MEELHIAYVWNVHAFVYIYILWTPLLAMNSLCWNLTMTLFRKYWQKKEEVLSPVHDADGKAVQKVVLHVNDVDGEVVQKVVMHVYDVGSEVVQKVLMHVYDVGSELVQKLLMHVHT